MCRRLFLPFVVLFMVSWCSDLLASGRLADEPEEDYTPITNLPTIFINTENGVGVTSKEEYVKAVVTVRNAANEEDNITEVEAEIKGRGNSTWGMAKKPYRLKFDKKIQLLGNDAKEKNWVLLANFADKTLMRNALAFETARNLFHFGFTPSVTFVDVVLNGRNIGNYLLTDQVEVKEKRVPVVEQETTVAMGDSEISGGYLIEVDGFAEQEISWFKTAKDMKITIKYPKDDEINAAQKNYISNYTQRMENALFSANMSDERRGWRRYVDEDSWIDWYIACELFGNSDSWWSTYMYKDRDEKFKMGPLWDFDIAFNNDYRIGDATQKFMRESACEPKTWIKQWWKDETLVEAVKKRWNKIGAENIRAFMNNYIDSTAALLDESQANNFKMWRVLDKRVHYEIEARGTYEAEVAFLRDYVNARIDFLDSAWGDPSGLDGVNVENNRLIIVPNPVEQGDEVTITSVPAWGSIRVTVAAVDGRIVYTSRAYANDEGEVAFGSDMLSSGVYIVIVSDSNSNIYRGTLVVK